MKEIEVKILDIDPIALEQKLLEMGAVKVFEGDIQADQYDFPDGRLDANRSFVRMRSKGEETELCLKRRTESGGAIHYDEFEIVVSDRVAAHEFLLNLGMVQTTKGRKKTRSSFQLGESHLEIDAFEGIPAFLELEAHSQEELEALMEKLGYTMADAKAWSGRDVLTHYGITPFLPL